MQKVEGSSPFSRFHEDPAHRGVFVVRRRDRGAESRAVQQRRRANEGLRAAGSVPTAPLLFVVTLSVALSMMGITSDRRFVRVARKQLIGLSSGLVGQSDLHKRRARLTDVAGLVMACLARECPGPTGKADAAARAVRVVVGRTSIAYEIAVYCWLSAAHPLESAERHRRTAGYIAISEERGYTPEEITDLQMIDGAHDLDDDDDGEAER